MNRAIITAVLLDTLVGQYYQVIDNLTAYEASLFIRAVIWSIVVFILVPYKNLLAKSIAFVFVLTQLWDLAALFLPVSNYLIVANIVIFVPWLLWAALKPYEAIGDNIEPNKVYFVAHRPDDAWGFLLSLFKSKPIGGSSVFIDHKLYGYHKGKFEIRNLPARLNIVAMDSGIENITELTDYLRSMDGVKWSILNNCVTLRWKVKNVQQ